MIQATTSVMGSNGRNTGKEQVRKLTLAAMLTAVVVVLALLGTAIRFGTFNVNLALVPIVIGAALLGVWYGAWFGFVNAMVILLSGDAGPFIAVNALGTVVTVVAKGVLAGLCSGLVYRAMQKHNHYAAVILAALVCPVVNTGVFLIGCRIFFWKTLSQWAQGTDAGSTFSYVIVFLVGVNFLLEVAINVILAPVIARLLGFSEDKNVSMITYGAVLAAVGLGILIFSLVLLTSALRNRRLATRSWRSCPVLFWPAAVRWLRSERFAGRKPTVEYEANLKILLRRIGRPSASDFFVDGCCSLLYNTVESQTGG